MRILAQAEHLRGTDVGVEMIECLGVTLCYPVTRFDLNEGLRHPGSLNDEVDLRLAARPKV